MNSILDVPCLTQALHIHEGGGGGLGLPKIKLLGGGGYEIFC